MLPLRLELPSHYLDEEERFGYLVPHEMKKVWAVELDLLNEFSIVCQKHDITWYADAGTILGAARHQGMIPWDDDIDVMLMRDEYEKLCKIAEKEFQHPYFFQTEKSDPGSIRGHAQLRNSLTTGMLIGEKPLKLAFNQGIFLDIFPIDNMPDDDDLALQQIQQIDYFRKRVWDYMSWHHRYQPPKNKFKRPIKTAIKIGRQILDSWIGDGYLNDYRRYEMEAQRYNKENTKRVAKLIMCPFKQRRIWERSYFESIEFLPFEMIKVPVPSGYKQILNCFYGDWHKYVIGTSTHGGVFFDTETPYTEYLK